jgi:LuxR family maltose regulon positive regulatory protein
MDGVESRLRDAERWLERPTDTGEQPVYGNEEEFQRLPGSISMYHAAIALARGDVENTLKYAREVLERAREDDYFMRGAASSLLGLAYWTSGDLETAYQTYSEGMAYLQRSGYISDVIGGSVTLADIRITQGRLHEAMSIYGRGLQLATKQDGPALRGAADMHVGMSDLYREWNELETAVLHLQKSKALGDLNGLPKNPYRWRVVMARIREIEGDFDQALALLDEAEGLYQGDFSPNVRPLPALKARVWIKQGRLPEALAWAREQGLSADGPLSYLHEFGHITLARILLAQHTSDGQDRSLDEAAGLLERLLNTAEEGGRMGSVIEILVLLALAYHAKGEPSAALQTLERALTLAEPGGYMRIFLDEGQAIWLLIEDLRSTIETRLHGEDEHQAAYIEKLMDAFARSSPVPQSSSENQKPKTESLVEPLTERELEVLRFFRTELSGPEIARELVVALSTVRTHTKSIYSKLNVNSRRAAVRRAEELGLI